MPLEDVLSTQGNCHPAVSKLKKKKAGHMTLIPALRRQRQVDLCEFEASLVYRVSSRAVRAT